MKAKATIVILTVVALAVICAPAVADPLPGQILKFQQKPMDGTEIFNNDGTSAGKYFGHDELSTAVWVDNGLYEGTFMADDFADKFNTPVVHVTWWGSYPDTPDLVRGVQQFAIVFESDVPAVQGNPDSFSHPGNVILAQTVELDTVIGGTLAPGTFNETFVSPGGGSVPEALYKYNAELELPFEQKPDTVYWLKIVALIGPDDEPNLRWGWHNRDYTIPNGLASAVPVPGERDERLEIGSSYPTPVWHFQDDAVTGGVLLQLDAATGGIPANGVDQTNYKPTFYVDGIDGPGPLAGAHGGIGRFSKDLAFELYTIPEPATLGLLGLGAMAMLRRRRKN